MQEFWKWMEEKSYASKEDMSDDIDIYQYKWCYMMQGVDNMEKVAPTKQMLIGYMEEYLLIKHGIGLGNRSDIYAQIHEGKKYGDIKYDQLEEAIITQTKRKST